MATKLYPPQLEGILPAFYKTYDDNGEVKKASIDIPFGLNRAVTLDEISALELRIKTVSTNTLIYLGQSSSFDDVNLIAHFTVDPDTASKLNEGLFYKAQLAFVNTTMLDGVKTSVIGYWSTVGTIKCVAKPSVTIAGYNEMEVNTFIQLFIGEYLQDTTFGDSTEKVETYEFNLWDNSNTLILSSGELLHDSSSDISSSSSTDIFKINHQINEGEMYYILYTVTTLNNLHISSPVYKVMQGTSVDIEYPLKLRCKNNYDNGYIELYLVGDYYEDGTEKMCTGTFMISRGSDKDNYFEWNEIVKFNMDGGLPSDQRYHFKDFTVELGITYKYRILQFNKYELYSNPVYLTAPQVVNINGENVIKETEIEVVADFEDMFLYDGTRLLRLRFNPKVTSFKNTIPEQKIETIGSKYPFIFRNGHVNYKEFPISGLISYSMDDAMLFLTEEELYEAKILETEIVRIPNIADRTGNSDPGHYISLKSYHENLHQIGKNTVVSKYLKYASWKPGNDFRSTDNKFVRQDKNLTSENMMGERYFKLKVLDWLTNGEVKLFRSPSEGNYLVRILNVSMLPTDSLGRMIHTFTGTCYEIDDLTYNNLIHYGIVSENIYTLVEMHWGSIYVNEYIANLLTPWVDFPSFDAKGNIIVDSNGKPIPLTSVNWNEFYALHTLSNTILGFECIDFAPGDTIMLKYAGDDDYYYFRIGETGYFNYDGDDRIIEQISIKPNSKYDILDYIDYSRLINYKYHGVLKRKFDTISDIYSKTLIAKQYIGPYNNVFEPLKLFKGEGLEKQEIVSVDEEWLNNTNESNNSPIKNEDFKQLLINILRHPNIILAEHESGNTIKFDTLQVEILHALKRLLIPVFAKGGITISDNNITVPHCALTPFGNGYVNYHSVLEKPEEWVKVVPSNVMDELLAGYENAINSYDIEIIDFNLATEENTIIDAYTILLIHVPVWGDDNKTFIEWQPTNYYFDTYTKDWLRDENGELAIYDPTFSINDNEENLKLIKTSSYDLADNDPRQSLMPYYIVQNWNNTIKEAVIQETVKYVINSPSLNWAISNVECEVISDNSLFANTNNVDLTDINEITLTKLGKLSLLRIGNGVMMELTFLLQIVDYAIEEDNTLLFAVKKSYLETKEDYFKQVNEVLARSNETLETDLIAAIAAQLKTMYENGKLIDTRYVQSLIYDEENDKIIYEVDQDNIPVYTVPVDDDTKKPSVIIQKNLPYIGDYQKIINETDELRSLVINPIYLKKLLVANTNKGCSDLLYGWNDNENLHHRGFLQLPYFDFGLYPDLTEEGICVTNNTDPNRFDHMVIDNDEILLDMILNVPDDVDKLVIGRATAGVKLIDSTEYPLRPNRTVPFSYETSLPYKNILTYGNNSDGTPMEDDNSYQVFSLSDPTYLTTLKALLIRLDADTFFTNYYETLDPRITTDFLFYNTLYPVTPESIAQQLIKLADLLEMNFDEERTAAQDRYTQNLNNLNEQYENGLMTEELYTTEKAVLEVTLEAELSEITALEQENQAEILKTQNYLTKLLSLPLFSYYADKEVFLQLDFSDNNPEKNYGPNEPFYMDRPIDWWMKDLNGNFVMKYKANGLHSYTTVTEEESENYYIKLGDYILAWLKDRYYSLADFYNELKYYSSAVRSFNLDIETYNKEIITDLFTLLYENHLTLLYFLIHHPMVKASDYNAIKNNILSTEERPIYQKKPQYLQFLTHCNLHTDVEELLNKRFGFRYFPYTENSLNTAHIYYKVALPLPNDSTNIVYTTLTLYEKEGLYYADNQYTLQITQQGSQWCFTETHFDSETNENIDTTYALYTQLIAYIIPPAIVNERERIYKVPIALSNNIQNNKITIDINFGENTSIEGVSVGEILQNYILDNIADEYSWREATGALVEARDDIVLATSNLISDNLFHWKILDLLSTLNETEQNAISVTIDGITYTVNKYLEDVLQADITEHENNLKAWQTALQEANKILAINPTDVDMIKLRDSAYFSIPMEEQALEKAIKDKKEFENSNPQYLLYKKMKDITDTIKTLKSQYEKDYITNNNKTGTLDLFNKASANYAIYWLLTIDLLYSSQSDKTTTEYTKEQLQTLLKDAMDNSQLYYEIPDFCFNEDNIFTSKFGCIVLDQKIMPLLNNMRDDFDLNTYDSYMEIYHLAYDDMITHVTSFLEEINRLETIYLTRGSFLAILDRIKENYEKLLEEAQLAIQEAALRYLNYIKLYKTALIDNATEFDDMEVWIKLTIYLLYLLHYYTEEIERRYDV